MRSAVLPGLAVASLLAGCGDKPAQPPRPQAPAPAATVAIPPAPASTLAGRYEALSTTAEAFTGPITVEGTAIESRIGLRYEAAPVAEATASDLADGAQNFADLMTTSKAARVEIRKVSREAVPKGAPNGGFCGGGPPTYLALALDGEGPARTLHLAAFQGADRPGAGKAVQLCGVFNYVPPSGG